MRFREIFSGIALVLIDLTLPLFQVIFKSFSVFLPHGVHEVLQIREALAIRPQVKPVVDPAKCFKPIAVSHAPDDCACATLANLHEDVKDELREHLHLWGKFFVIYLAGMCLSEIQVPGHGRVEKDRSREQVLQPRRVVRFLPTEYRWLS